MSSCVLCETRIQESGRVVYQDEHVFVLVNIEPIKDGHVMILPVRHAEQLSDLTPEESQAFLKMIDKCMSTVTQHFQETPMCLVNGWKYRSQPHLHAHVLPSKKNLRGLYTAAEGLEERKRADNETLNKMADALRAYFTHS